MPGAVCSLNVLGCHMSVPVVSRSIGTMAPCAPHRSGGEELFDAPPPPPPPPPPPRRLRPETADTRKSETFQVALCLGEPHLSQALAGVPM